MTIGNRIISLRKAQQFSQEELADKIGVSRQAVSKWERGESIPDIFVLKQIADLFGVTVDFLISDHKDKCLKKASKRKERFIWLSFLCACGIVAMSCLLFVLSWIFAEPIWQIFIYTVPVLMIVMLVLSSVFGFKKLNFWWISVLVISLIICLYVTFLSFVGINIYQLLILILPAEFVVFSVFGSGFKRQK